MKKKIIKSRNAFTLVELMIAIGIIITLAALSINGLLRARMTAYRAAAMSGLKTAQAAFENYKAMNGVYPSTFWQLCQANPPYLDSRWYDIAHAQMSPEIQGYTYLIYDSSDYQYGVEADSINNGGGSFYIREDGEIVEMGVVTGLGGGFTGIPQENNGWGDGGIMPVETSP